MTRNASPAARIFESLSAYVRNVRGAAAAEFALVSALFVVMLGNVVDVGIYAYDKMQVTNAGQVLAETIFNNCPRVFTPVTVACETSVNSNGPLTNDKINAAVQESSLGSLVSYKDSGGASTISEGWYCVNSSGALVLYSADMTSSPTNCSSGGGVGSDTTSKCTRGTGTSVSSDSNAPGDYVCFTVKYTYTPLFGHLSVASLLPATISKTVWIRVG